MPSCVSRTVWCHHCRSRRRRICLARLRRGLDDSKRQWGLETTADTLVLVIAQPFPTTSMTTEYRDLPGTSAGKPGIFPNRSFYIRRKYSSQTWQYLNNNDNNNIWIISMKLILHRFITSHVLIFHPVASQQLYHHQTLIYMRMGTQWKQGEAGWSREWNSDIGMDLRGFHR